MSKKSTVKSSAKPVEVAPKEKSVVFDFADFPRRKVRYWCARFKNELEGGAKTPDAPDGLKKHIESIDGFQIFGGWPNYAVKWDWTGKPSGLSAVELASWKKLHLEGAPLLIIPLTISLAEIWEKQCLENAKELPSELLMKLQHRKDANVAKTRPPVKEVVIDAVIPKGGGIATVTKRKDGEKGNV